MSWKGVKKQVSVLTTSTLVTKSSEKAILVGAKELEQVMCIRYSIAFPSGVTQNSLALDPVSALFDSNSEVNAMHPAFVEKLDFMV